MFKKLLKAIAYFIFFLISLLFFIRQTLPLETLRDRLIEAAAHQGFELELGELELSGFLGLRANQVSLRRAPNPEELEALKRWREARAARRAADRHAEEGAGGSAGAGGRSGCVGG